MHHSYKRINFTLMKKKNHIYNNWIFLEYKLTIDGKCNNDDKKIPVRVELSCKRETRKKSDLQKILSPNKKTD